MAINHVSYLDFTFAGLAAQPAHRMVRFMAKQVVFGHPVAGPLMRGMHHIEVDRDAGAQSYRRATTALRAGEIIGVFPEATISVSFELKAFKTGAARMAIDAGVPLLPTVIWGSQRIMTKGRPRNLRRRHIPVFISVGEPVPTRPDDSRVAITAVLKERMQELLDKAQAAYPDQPAGPEDSWWLPARLGGTAPTLAEAAVLETAAAAERRARRAGN
jgi:1-acyl-sn-glycerol-3-phosphate acyltransferase